MAKKDYEKEILKNNKYISIHVYQDGSRYVCAGGDFIEVTEEENNNDNKLKYKKLYDKLNELGRV